jgi:hypothetical protein
VSGYGMPTRDHIVSHLTDCELDHARRELAASLALARPDSPARVPIEAQLSAIDAEVAERAASAGLRVCGCGLASDDDAFFDGHLFERPSHEERDLGRYVRR